MWRHRAPDYNSHISQLTMHAFTWCRLALPPVRSKLQLRFSSPRSAYNLLFDADFRVHAIVPLVPWFLVPRLMCSNARGRRMTWYAKFLGTKTFTTKGTMVPASAIVCHFVVALKQLNDIVLLNKSPQSYRASLAIWDNTVLPSNRHKWKRPA